MSPASLRHRRPRSGALTTHRHFVTLPSFPYGYFKQVPPAFAADLVKSIWTLKTGRASFGRPVAKKKAGFGLSFVLECEGVKCRDGHAAMASCSVKRVRQAARLMCKRVCWLVLSVWPGLDVE